MLYFYWNKNFETGHRRIDDQHRQLVVLINKLSEAFIQSLTSWRIRHLLVSDMKLTRTRRNTGHGAASGELIKVARELNQEALGWKNLRNYQQEVI